MTTFTREMSHAECELYFHIAHKIPGYIMYQDTPVGIRHCHVLSIKEPYVEFEIINETPTSEKKSDSQADQ